MLNLGAAGGLTNMGDLMHTLNISLFVPLKHPKSRVGKWDLL